MAKKKAFALRVNEDMIKAIEKWAADEFRSTNGQIEWMLMQALKEAKRAPKKKEEKLVKILIVKINAQLLLGVCYFVYWWL